MPEVDEQAVDESAAVSERKSRSGGPRDIIHGMTGKLAVLCINAATGVICARALNPTGRGEQVAMITWPTLLALSTTLGLPSALSVYLKRPGAEWQKLINAALALSLLISLLTGSLALLFLPQILHHYPAYVVTWARIFMVVLPLSSFLMIARAVLEADGQFQISVISQWAFPGITLIMLLGFLLTGKLNPISASIAYIANNLPIAAWLFTRLRRIIRIEIENPIIYAKKLLSYGLPAYGIDLCSTLSANVDVALVAGSLPPKALGLYVVALSISRTLAFCQSAVTMVLLPKAAGCRPDTVIDLTARAARATLVVSSVAAIAIGIIAPVLIKILYGASFAAALGPFRVFLFEAVVGGVVTVLAQAAMALGKPGLVTSLQVLGLAISVPLMLVLIPRIGLIGAAFAITGSTVVRLILILISFPLLLRYPVPSLLITKSELQVLFKIGTHALSGRLHRSYAS